MAEREIEKEKGRRTEREGTLEKRVYRSGWSGTIGWHATTRFSWWLRSLSHSPSLSLSLSFPLPLAFLPSLLRLFLPPLSPSLSARYTTRHRVHIAFSHAPPARFSYPTRPRDGTGVARKLLERFGRRRASSSRDSAVPLPPHHGESPVAVDLGCAVSPFRRVTFVRGVSGLIDDSSAGSPRGPPCVKPNVSSRFKKLVFNGERFFSA